MENNSVDSGFQEYFAEVLQDAKKLPGFNTEKIEWLGILMYDAFVRGYDFCKKKTRKEIINDITGPRNN
jgi:hypothetical protein